ncbi:hypothetical protein JKV55_10990 [Zobellella sp. CGMCC 1.18722]|uniref:Beta-3-deoxy-D-manno-oct-2-ulosonic acid transferase n=1 Tax=Zobellella iuensis TaxID=2803811 RepID=A0ABS1QSN4_9GAMM|nr:hypothetical protein [Zobellella iuensis]
MPPVDTLYAVGFSLWRRRFAPRFLSRYARQVKFVDRPPAGPNLFDRHSSTEVDPTADSGATIVGSDLFDRHRSTEVDPAADTGATIVGSNSFDRTTAPLAGRSTEVDPAVDPAVRPAGAVLVWGRQFERELAACPLPVWRMEDGFLRSVGLGSDLRRPGSLVIDNQGIYYDPRTPSAIEHYLASHEFGPQELAQGEQLMAHFKARALTKYNVGTQVELGWRKLAGARAIILVPGQVDDDASILLGSPFVQGNAALLQAVRAAHPQAFIVFKPHPDVVSGNRRGRVPEAVLACCADLVETQAGIVACLDECDAVHTLTSLTGLEALIRGRPVTVWGQPFYAGWGLTRDQHPVGRRGRPLPLAALVYATYAWYPSYVDYPTGLYSTPLRMAWRLDRERERFREPDNALLRGIHRRLYKARFLWEALRG